MIKSTDIGSTLYTNSSSDTEWPWVNHWTSLWLSFLNMLNGDSSGTYFIRLLWGLNVSNIKSVRTVSGTLQVLIKCYGCFVDQWGFAIQCPIMLQSDHFSFGSLPLRIEGIGFSSSNFICMCINLCNKHPLSTSSLPATCKAW